MSDVFAKLFEEGERQRQQFQERPTSNLAPNERTVSETVRNEQPNERTVERVPQPERRTVFRSEQANDRSVSTPQRPIERPTVRYSYEFYVDQVEAVRRLRAQRELQGKKVGLSEIAREALDAYLKQVDPK